MSSQSIFEGTFFQAKRLLISHCLSSFSVLGTASLYVVSSKIIQMLSREVTSRDFAGRSSFAIKFPNPSGTQGRAPVKEALDRLTSRKKVYCSPKHWNYFSNHEFFVFTFLSVQFKYSVQRCVFVKFEVCILVAFIPHTIFLFPVICFKFSITRTLANYLIIGN